MDMRKVILTLALVLWAAGTKAASAAELPQQQCPLPPDTQSFSFSSQGNELAGFIDSPGPGPNPAIVLVQGSGSTDVMNDERWSDGYFRRLRMAFHAAGLATVAWDKAGYGCSHGSYAAVTPLRARASEVVAAIAALKMRQDIDAKRIGIWAISQGGWVAPMAAVRSKDVSFLLLVSSPASDAVSQLGDQAIYALRAQGITGTELQDAATSLRRAFAIMRAGGSVEEYAAAVMPLRPYTVLQDLGITAGPPDGQQSLEEAANGYRNWQSTIDQLYRPDTALNELTQPTLAMFGDHDTLVNWRESIAVYRQAFRRPHGPDLTIKVFRNADHGLLRVSAPSGHSNEPDPGASRFVDGYLDVMIRWLRNHNIIPAQGGSSSHSS